MNVSDNSHLSVDGKGEQTFGSGSETNTNSALSSTFNDERSRLERKIEKLREEITRNSIVREGDIEEYLKLMKNRPENAQIARIRQHFEKKNRKYTQETEHLQVFFFVLYFLFFYIFFLEKIRNIRKTFK